MAESPNDGIRYLAYPSGIDIAIVQFVKHRFLNFAKHVLI